MERKLIFCLLIIILLTGCSGKEVEKQDSIIIASWNVENLFDAIDDGTEYDEYKKVNGWTDSQYRVRLKKIQTVLGYDYLKDASVIVLNEVENENVTEDLLRTIGKFKYYACAGVDGPISLAVISKIPICDAKVHGITGQRPVLEVDLEIDGTALVLLAVHGKSNLGDMAEDVSLRNETGLVLEQLCRQIRLRKPLCTIVIAGDFNEQLSDSNIIQSPDSWISNWDFGSFVGGSYCYEDEWQRFDNIVVSKNCIWKAVDGNVVFHGILQSLDNKPDSWKRYLLSGVSDHLPVWIKMER